MTEPLNTVEASVDRLSGGGPISDVAAATAPLLRALRWQGTPRQLAEALPSRWDSMEKADFRNMLANLGFESRSQAMRMGSIDPRLMPCLFLADNGGRAYVLYRDEQTGAVRTFDCKTRQSSEGLVGGVGKGRVVFFTKSDAPSGIQVRPGQSWIRSVLMRFEGFAVQLLFLTFLLNMLALATPLFVMAVYDKVIATGDRDTLIYLFVGVGLALACDAVLRSLRGALLAYVGGRIDMIVGVAGVEKIMDLPLRRLEQASVGSQVARLREFEGIRTFFTGPLALSFMELPFVVIFLVAIAWIGGWIALIPVVLMGVMAVIGTIMIRYARTAVQQASAGSADAQGLLVELLANVRQIKADGKERIWIDRYRERSTALALSNLRNARISAFIQSFGQFIMVLAGAATLAIGTWAAFGGAMTVGGLIGSMALVWRVLSPMQMLFVALTRLEEVKNAVKRVDQLMGQQTESRQRSSSDTVARKRRFDGKIEFSKVVMRYNSTHEPALAGVSFAIEPGEVVAIAGSNGSGKSTVLKLIADLYTPQAGTVMIDGVDTRQLNLIDLRHGIGYLPQESHLFTGTIAENLRLGNPMASDQDLRDALLRAGVLDDVEAHPGGLNAMLNETARLSVSSGFLKGICIARTLLTDAAILLFDEPGSALDKESDEKFINLMKELRGKATTIIVTHRPSYIRASDRAIVLNDGAVMFDGKPEDMNK
ncbi:MAG: peptidase domain-containing ABC transporter [Magnetovibrionaceae bacterium]